MITIEDEPYDRLHPNYYCYLTRCSIEDIKAYLSHRNIEFDPEWIVERLVSLLQADDKRFAETKKASCDCCPWDDGPESNNSHFGCEDCGPHWVAQ